MKKSIFIIIFTILVSGYETEANTWQKVVAQINQDIIETQKDIEKRDQLVRNERNKLKNELSSLTQSVAQDEKSLETLQAQFEEMIQTEERLRQEIEAEEEKIKSLEEILRTTAKDTDEIIAASLIMSENDSRQARLLPLLEPKRFPGMTDIENLVSVLFEEIKDSGEVRIGPGTFINSEGKEVSGKILRIGKFTACYQLGDEVGYLRADRNLRKLVAIPGKPPWQVRRAIQKCFSGESQDIPLDLSSGVIIEQVNQSSDIRGWIESGGLLVLPIFLIGIVAVILSLERLYSLGRIPANTDKIMTQVDTLLADGDWQGCQELCDKKKKAPTCNVLKAGLQYAKAKKEVLENAIEEAILKELPRLERFLTTLSVLAAVAPLLGLLGTVTGMIHTFQGITVFGTSDPRMMSGGISEALITTQLGLAVAIPIMIAHHFFDRRVEKIIGDMEEKGTSLMTSLLKVRSGGSEK